jgi:hypothetical protein
MSVVRARQRLLIVQTACTALMLYLAALAGFSYLNVVRFDYGFDAENVVIIEPPYGHPPGARGEVLTKSLLAMSGRVATMAERLTALPEVEIATPINDAPIARGHTDTYYNIIRFDGRQLDPTRARIVSAGDDFLQALGATLLSGTGFNDPRYLGRTDVVGNDPPHFREAQMGRGTATA